MNKIIIFLLCLIFLVSGANAEAVNIVTNNNASIGQTIYFLTTVNSPKPECNYHLDIYLGDIKHISYSLNVPTDTISFQVPSTEVNQVTAIISRHAKDIGNEQMYFNSNLFSVSVPITSQTQAQSESSAEIAQTMGIGRVIFGLLVTFMFLEGLQRI